MVFHCILRMLCYLNSILLLQRLRLREMKNTKHYGILLDFHCQYHYPFTHMQYIITTGIIGKEYEHCVVYTQNTILYIHTTMHTA